MGMPVMVATVGPPLESTFETTFTYTVGSDYEDLTLDWHYCTGNLL